MISLNENTGGREKVGLNDVTKAAASYAETRDEIGTLVGELNAEIDAITKAKMPQIKRLVTALAKRHAELESSIEAAPHLFERPRTVVFHGIKCGFRKNEGTIAFDDADLTVKKIKQLFESPDIYLHTKETPNKDALANLSARELKSIGARVEETTDVIVIKPIDTDLEKKINALVKGAIEETAAQ